MHGECPDGEGIVFQSNRSGSVNLYWAPIRGAAAPEALTHGRRWWVAATSVSPDGQRVAFIAVIPAGLDIWTVDRGDPTSARPLVARAAAEALATFSPDWRFLAYASNDSGRKEVYLRALQGDQSRHQVSHKGGNSPLWSPEGREIFYESGARMMSASVATAPDLRIGEPRELFEIPSSIRGGIAGRSYDVTPDGQRFLMVQWPEGSTPQIVVIPDFREELLARLATPAK